MFIRRFFTIAGIVLFMAREGEGGGNNGGGSGSGDQNNSGNGDGNGSGNQNGSGNNNNGGGSNSGGGSQNAATGFDASYVKSLRDEAAEHRVAARDASKRAETAEAKVTELEGKFKAINTDSALTAGIAGAGVKPEYADVIKKLLDTSKLDLDGDGKPSADKLKTEFTALKEKYPAMFGIVKGSVDAGAGGGGSASASTMNDFIRKAAGRSGD